MIYGSVCSGIEAATVAWHPLGWRPAFFSEIEPFPRAVLAHHYPDVPLHGDFTTIQPGQYDPIDLLVGGTPCQSFSVAGLRGGLADDRGNLALEYLRLADRLRPRWLVWENVPGVLSSGGGRDFGSILGGLVELGYGFAYRVLDAQYFGVAQRRRRVFVVGYLGDWRRAAAVLFERHSLQGHPAPRREAGKGFAAATAPSLTASGRGVERTGESRGQDPIVACGLIPAPHAPISPSLKARDSKGVSSDGDGDGDGAILVPMLAHALRAEGFDASEDGTGRGTPLVPVASRVLTLAIRGREGQPTLECRDDGTANAILTPNGGRAGIGVGAIAYRTAGDGAVYEEGDSTAPLTTGTDSSANIVAFGENQRGEVCEGDITRALQTQGGKPGQGYPAVRTGMQVRRLTPEECEALQGFPRGYTAIQVRGKPAADGPRYKALGNSMAVPCMAWIGQRIAIVEAIDAH
jgi:DNA (cytosine-5)-methyltransferase 1